MKLIQLFKTVAGTGKWICLGGILSISSALYAGQYFQNFAGFSNGATNFNDGSTLSSTALGTIAGVTNLENDPVSGSSYGELQLTEVGVTNVQSAFELPDLDPGTPVYAFSVKWNSDVNRGSTPDGEGFSFNFGPLSSVNLITNNAEESGYGAGLCFSAQTTSASAYDPFHLLLNGTIIATDMVYTAYDWGVNNPTRHFWEVDWNYYSGMSVRLDGQPIFTNVPTPGFVPEAGDVFAWGARCGTNSEEIRMDNIVAVTGGNLVQLPTSGPYFADQGLAGYDGYSVTNAFDGTNSTYYEDEGPIGSVGATISPPNPVLMYALTSGENPTGTPHKWTLEGSTNGGAAWTECCTGGGYFVNAAETRAWLATNSLPDYGAYELMYSGSFGAISTIGELRFYALSVVKAPYLGWTKQTDIPDGPNQEWESIASSADGTKLAATAEGDGIFISTNSGKSWYNALSTGGSDWNSIASSSDGNNLAAVILGGGIDTNFNFDGSTVFLNTSALSENWRCIASSSNGVNLTAGIGTGGGIYVSANSGQTWTESSAPSEEWYSIASSSDGSRLVAGVNGGGIYVSSDFGNTWKLTSAPNGSWYSIASSSDGTNLAAAASELLAPTSLGAIYISSNAGNTWTPAPGTSDKVWRAIACSSDGTKLAAAIYGGGIYFSTNSGNTWTNSGATNGDWDSIASSSDGSKCAAVAFEGGLYTFGTATPPSAFLHGTVSGGYPVLSWSTTNAGNFVLQENTNLPSTNWLNVTLPVTVTTNGSTYQVTDVPSANQKFYRLVAQ